MELPLPLSQKLARRANRLRLAKHQLLVREGAPADCLYVLIDGALTLWKQRHDGDHQVTGFLFPADVFGVAAEGRHICSARACTAAQLLALDRQEFEALCDRDAEVRHAVFHGALNDLAAVQDQIVLLGRKTPLERLGSFLLHLQRRQRARGWAQHAPDTVWLPMRRSDIASYLGLHLGTVSRAFGELRRRRLVTLVSTTEARLLDAQTLAGLSEPA